MERASMIHFTLRYLSLLFVIVILPPNIILGSSISEYLKMKKGVDLLQKNLTNQDLKTDENSKPTEERINQSNENINEATKIFTELLENGYDHPSIYNNLGHALFQSQDFEQARALYQQSLEKMPLSKRSMASYYLGNTYMLENKFEKAIEAYKKALQYDNTNTLAKHNLEIANVYSKQMENQSNNNENSSEKNTNNDKKNDNSKDNEQENQSGEKNNQSNEAKNNQKEKNQSENKTGSKNEANSKNDEKKQSDNNENTPSKKEDKENSNDKNSDEGSSEYKEEPSSEFNESENKARRLLNILSQKEKEIRKKYQVKSKERIDNIEYSW